MGFSESAAFRAAIERFDAENARDPNLETADGHAQPRELLYAKRLTDWTLRLAPDASEALRLAARCQHICRWMIPRNSQPMTRGGYLRWRTELKKFHANKAGAILRECGYAEAMVAQVQALNLKKNFPNDPDSRVLEDALCLVFLEFQFAELAAKTEREKVINALRKSWEKMTDAARARALALPFGAREKELVGQALGASPAPPAGRFTLGHSPDPDDAFMFYALAGDLIPTHGLRFEHILQDIQTLNERATRGELDVTAVSFHAYAHICQNYALLPSGASMGDGYGPMIVAPRTLTREQVGAARIAVPGTMTSAFLALQLWLGKPADKINYVVVPFDQIFQAVRSGAAEAGLIIHEGQLTWQREGLVMCQDLGAWWQRENDGLPLPLGGNVVHKRIAPETRSLIARLLRESIQFSLDHRADAARHALQYARDMDLALADRFIGMYVNHWTLDYGDKGREAIRRFLGQAAERGLIPRAPELEFVA